MEESLRCEDVERLMEPLAAGEPASAAVTAHLGSCPACASALELARRIDRLLQAREAPSAPERFTTAVLARLHRERWRSEQFLDWGFNIAIAAGLVLIAGGVWLLLNVTGLTALTTDISTALVAGREIVLLQILAALPTYGAATLLLMTMLGVWWWADRRVVT